DHRRAVPPDARLVAREFQRLAEEAGGLRGMSGAIVDQRDVAQVIAEHHLLLAVLETALLGDRELAEVLEADRAPTRSLLLHERVDGREGRGHQEEHDEQEDADAIPAPPAGGGGDELRWRGNERSGAAAVSEGKVVAVAAAMAGTCGAARGDGSS